MKKRTTMANKPYPCRLGNKRLAEISESAKGTGLTVPETLRQAVDYGLPIVRKKFAKKK